MRKIITFFLSAGFVFCAATQASAQNLAPNPGFEVQDTCPAVSQISKAPPWVSATLGTPDLYNSTCSMQNLAARTGIGSSGIYLLNTFANNREYMEAPLTAPLAAGTMYNVSFYVKRLNYRYASDRIGAHFHVGSFSQNTTSVLALVPQVDHPQHTLLNAAGWQLVSGSFVAAGGEDHIVIGSFSTDANTDTVVANSASTSKVSYYAIDDISVTSAVGIEENASPLSLLSVFPNPATSNIHVLLRSSQNVSFISIANELGQQVRSISSPLFMNGELVISTEGLKPGLYFVEAITEKGKAIKKISIIE